MNYMVHPDIRYEHTKTKNHYQAFYKNTYIGTVRYTPDGPGTWTFQDTGKTTETFGSTRLQAVRKYLELFQRGEG